ncbi:hypothetical protein ABFX02_02G068100 [Erythranthe guttata]
MSVISENSIIPTFTYPPLIIAATITFLVLIYILSTKPRPVYLIDFICYRPPSHLRVSMANFAEHLEIYSIQPRDTIDFQVKMAEKSGIGNESAFPLSLHRIPLDNSLPFSRQETETVLFTAVDQILDKHKVNPKSIDILITNCSIFCPTPSISSTVINKFGFRSNVKSFSLSGMGCGAGLVAVGLAKDLLKVSKNSLALVLSMEAVTPSGYNGNIKSMLLANALFRMGGVAVLLSNKKQDQSRAKYKLRYLFRTHMGSNDRAYQSVYQQSDDTGEVGVSLSRSLLHVAANALKLNITELGPRVLPISEMLLYLKSVVQCKFLNRERGGEIYIPDFKKAFEHFCIHAGGRAVIDAVEGRLKLSREDGEASRMTLHRFGNTSSSSVWYELAYLEAKGRVKNGDRVWQIGFGSGFKCNSAVWECVSEIDTDVRNAWSDCIDSYPVEIPDVADH